MGFNLSKKSKEVVSNSLPQLVCPISTIGMSWFQLNESCIFLPNFYTNAFLDSTCIINIASLSQLFDWI